MPLVIFAILFMAMFWPVMMPVLLGIWLFDRVFMVRKGLGRPRYRWQ